jgi:hypothetical protein
MDGECGVDRSPDDGYSQSLNHWAPGAVGSNKVVAKHFVLATCVPLSDDDFHTIAVVDVADVFVTKPNLCTAFDSLIDEYRFQEALG